MKIENDMPEKNRGFAGIQWENFLKLNLHALVH